MPETGDIDRSGHVSKWRDACASLASGLKVAASYKSGAICCGAGGAKGGGRGECERDVILGRSEKNTKVLALYRDLPELPT
jgi:hypothetical protein